MSNWGAGKNTRNNQSYGRKPQQNKSKSQRDLKFMGNKSSEPPQNNNSTYLRSIAQPSKQGKPSEDIKLQQDRSSASFDEYQQLGTWIDDYACYCKKCQREGYDKITRQSCLKQLVLSLKKQNSQLKQRIKEADLIKTEIREKQETQFKEDEEEGDCMLNFLKERIREVEDRLKQQQVEHPHVDNQQSLCQNCEQYAFEFCKQLMEWFTMQKEGYKYKYATPPSSKMNKNQDDVDDTMYLHLQSDLKGENVSELKEKLSNSQKRIEQLDAQIIMVKESQGNYSVTLAEKDELINKYSEEKQELIREIGEKQSQIQKLKKDKENIQNQLTLLQRAQSQDKLKNETLNQKSQEKREENSRLDSKIKQLEVQIDQLSKKNQEQIHEIQSLRATLNKYKTEKSQFIQNKLKQQAKIGKAKQQWQRIQASMKQEIFLLTTANKEFRIKIQTLNVQQKEIVTSLEKWKQQFELKCNEEQQAHKKDLEQSEKLHKSQLDNLKTQQQKSIHQLQEKQQQDISTLKESYQTKLDEKEQINYQLDQEIQTLKNQVTKLSESHLNTFIQQTQILTKRTTLFGQFVQKQGQDKQTAKSQQNQNCKALLSFIQILQDKQHQLKKPLAHAINDSNYYQLEVKAHIQEQNHLRTIIQEYQQEASALRTQHQQDITNMNNKLTDLDNAWNKKCQELSSLIQTNYKAILQSSTLSFTTKIQILEAHIQDLEETIQYQSQLATLSDRLNTKEIEDLNNTILFDKEQHEKQVKRLKNHIQEYEAEVGKKEASIARLEDEKLKLDVQIHQYQDLIQGVNRTAGQFLGSITTGSMKELLEKASLGFESHIDSLFRMVNTINIFYEELSINCEKVQATNTALQTGISTLEQQLLQTKVRLQKNISEKETQINVLKVQVEDISGRLDKQSKAKNDLMIKLSSQENKMKAEQQKVGEHEQTIQNLIVQLSSLESQSTGVQTTQKLLNDKNNEVNRLNQDCARLKKDNENLISEVSFLKTEVTRLKEDSHIEKEKLNKEIAAVTEQTRIEKEKLKKEITVLKEESRKSMSLKTNEESKKIEESEQLLNQFLNENQQKSQQISKLKNKVQECQRQSSQLSKKLAEAQARMKDRKITQENTISKKQHLSQIQELQTIIEQQELELKKFQRVSHSSIFHSNQHSKQDKLQEENEELSRRNGILEEKLRELEQVSKKESPLTRKKSEKGFLPPQQENCPFISFFSSQTLLDISAYRPEKEFLIKSVEEHTKRSIKETSLSFSYNLKNRIFNNIVNKSIMTNDENFVFLFRTKTKNNQPNLFAFIIFKTGQKMVPSLGFAALLTKKIMASKKKEASTTIQPISFDYTGSEITFGGTYKIKSGDTKIKAQSQSKYFELQSPFEIFEKESKEVELQNMEIHKMILE